MGDLFDFAVEITTASVHTFVVIMADVVNVGDETVCGFVSAVVDVLGCIGVVVRGLAISVADVGRSFVVVVGMRSKTRTGPA